MLDKQTVVPMIVSISEQGSYVGVGLLSSFIYIFFSFKRYTALWFQSLPLQVGKIEAQSEGSVLNVALEIKIEAVFT